MFHYNRILTIIKLQQLNNYTLFCPWSPHIMVQFPHVYIVHTENRGWVATSGEDKMQILSFTHFCVAKIFKQVYLTDFKNPRTRTSPYNFITLYPIKYHVQLAVSIQLYASCTLTTFSHNFLYLSCFPFIRNPFILNSLH